MGVVVDDTGGDGMPVVCLPMLGMSRAASALAFGPALAGRGSREVYLDLPGHGDAPGEGAADSRTILDTSVRLAAAPPAAPGAARRRVLRRLPGNLTALADGRGYDALNQLITMTESGGRVDLFAYNIDHKRTNAWYHTTGALGAPVASVRCAGSGGTRRSARRPPSRRISRTA